MRSPKYSQIHSHVFRTNLKCDRARMNVIGLNKCPCTCFCQVTSCKIIVIYQFAAALPSFAAICWQQTFNIQHSHKTECIIVIIAMKMYLDVRAIDGYFIYVASVYIYFTESVIELSGNSQQIHILKHWRLKTLICNVLLIVLLTKALIAHLLYRNRIIHFQLNTFSVVI